MKKIFNDRKLAGNEQMFMKNIFILNHAIGITDQHAEMPLSARMKLQQLSPRGKTNNVVSEQVRHKLGCTSTEAG